MPKAGDTHSSTTGASLVEGEEPAHDKGDPKSLTRGPKPPLFDYLLRLGDNDLVLAQRLGEWVGKGPALEEDIASTNIGLDLLGQARLWLGYAAEIGNTTEDRLAYFRDSGEFRNLLIVEQPNGHYGDTIARQYFFDQWHALVLAELATSRDARVVAIAAKALTEVCYHLERSSGWVVRLGDGTDLSHTRMQAAVDAMWPYTGEMFAVDDIERTLIDARAAPDVQALHMPWIAAVRSVFSEAALAVPSDAWMHGAGNRGGKQGVHTEHLSHMLAEMQVLPRSHPDARW
ncbi:MAG TPA: 1,2-phenylacetyl-CoA epoxidase subunit PaaC [Casimicrobiaceae bacterium]|nr:1,2-phenylacetyl-CoA epoxidase subunit PaaC [Casimicrobiaceae bacterium]